MFYWKSSDLIMFKEYYNSNVYFVEEPENNIITCYIFGIRKVLRIMIWSEQY